MNTLAEGKERWRKQKIGRTIALNWECEQEQNRAKIGKERQGMGRNGEELGKN